MHARTAAQLYAGEARWEAIAALVEQVRSIPVLGNGDIWEAWDALRMMRETGCAGVVVGRGCLGRPWLFRDLADVFAGASPRIRPPSGEVARVDARPRRAPRGLDGRAARRAQLPQARDLVHEGLPDSTRLRDALIRIESSPTCARSSTASIRRAVPAHAMRLPRGKRGGTQRVALPDGYLDDLGDATPPAAELAAADAVSGVVVTRARAPAIACGC
jgi:tRNA-dihydrouridine synthase